MADTSINAQIHKQLQNLLDQITPDNRAEKTQLNNALRLLSKWRSVLIQNTLLQQQGTVVMQGPLQGLDFLPQSAEGCHIAKLLGCYEQPLQPYIEQAIQKQYATILNIDIVMIAPPIVAIVGGVIFYFFYRVFKKSRANPA